MLVPAYRRGSLTAPGGAQIQFVQIGQGPIPVLVIPGAGDGLTMAADGAGRLAWFYRRRASTHRVLVVSRRQPIPADRTAEQLAADYLWAAVRLSWQGGIVECNSGGGPIGHWLAAMRPDLLHGLILSVTLHRPSKHTREVLAYWRDLAQRGDWETLLWSSIEHTFRPRTVVRYRLLRPLLRFIARPAHPERMVRIFDGLLRVDTTDVLPRIVSPTLVIGGEDDRVIDAGTQREMAVLIPNSRLILYPGYGHGNDQENPDYEVQATTVMREVWKSG